MSKVGATKTVNFMNPPRTGALELGRSHIGHIVKILKTRFPLTPVHRSVKLDISLMTSTKSCKSIIPLEQGSFVWTWPYYI